MPLSPDDATLASKVFQLISEGRLKTARAEIDKELLAREPVSELDAITIVAAYNHIGLPKVSKLTDSRKRSLYARMKEHSNPLWWVQYFKRVSESDFLMGRSTRWSASFDWLLKPANMTKVLEGNYDNRDARRGLDDADEAAYRLSNVG